MSLFSLEGRKALITGASSGLGRHFALTLARAGANVALAARRRERLDEVRSEIENLGRRAVALEMDVTDGQSVIEAVEAAWERLEGLDVLVNNAGVSVMKPALEADEGEWDRVLDTNLKGAYLVARAVGARMVARGQGGAIVNNASAIGIKVLKGIASYAVSKAGLIQLTRALALELAPHGIRVNALAPGYVETEMNREFFTTPAGERLIRRIPQRRLGETGDLDGALLLLASDASRYMTGSVLVVDGGLSLS